MAFTKRMCSCTIFLVQILLIRPWLKAQHTINLCRGWVKELSLSELSQSDAWTMLLQKQKHKNGYPAKDSISWVQMTHFSSPSLRYSSTLYRSLIII